jgi:hypothetical protein
LFVCCAPLRRTMRVCPSAPPTCPLHVESWLVCPWLLPRPWPLYIPPVCVSAPVSRLCHFITLFVCAVACTHCACLRSSWQRRWGHRVSVWGAALLGCSVVAPARCGRAARSLGCLRAAHVRACCWRLHCFINALCCQTARHVASTPPPPPPRHPASTCDAARACMLL